MGFDVKTVRLYEKIALLRQRMRELEQIKKQFQKKPDRQLSLTDPDPRSMTSGGKRTARSATTFRPPWTRSIIWSSSTT